MLILPAIIIGMLGGTIAAAACLFAGFGLLDMLIAYWLAGNLAMLLCLIAFLLRPPCRDGRPAPRTRPAFGRTEAGIFWILLGLAMVFWDAFMGNQTTQAHGDPTALAVLQNLADLNRPPVETGSLEAMKVLWAKLSDLHLWIPGVLSYCYGVSRTIRGAAHRLAEAETT